MASMMKKAMIYLGLGPDEEYEQYEDYAGSTPTPEPDRPPRPAADARGRGQAGGAPIHPRVEERPLVHPQRISTGTVRPIAPEPSPPTHEAAAPAPEPAPARPAASPQERVAAGSSAVRTIGPANAMPHAVSPASFNEAQEIGDRFKAGQPVIVNLQGVDRDLRRRLVDFSSGLCYAIAGKMERVADQVYLLTPADVEVPIEETRRHLD